MQDQVWNRVTVNRAEKKSTRYYMDEFHLLLKEEQTAAYSVEIWKRFRKWGGIPTAITQNVKDLLSCNHLLMPNCKSVFSVCKVETGIYCKIGADCLISTYQHSYQNRTCNISQIWNKQEYDPGNCSSLLHHNVSGKKKCSQLRPLFENQ